LDNGDARDEDVLKARQRNSPVVAQSTGDLTPTRATGIANLSVQDGRSKAIEFLKQYAPQVLPVEELRVRFDPQKLETYSDEELYKLHFEVSERLKEKNHPQQ